MNKHLLGVLLILAFCIPVFGQEQSARPITQLSGKYYSVEHLKDAEVIDAIEFHPDGSCLVDIGGSNGVNGKYRLWQKNNSTGITIETGTAGPTLTYDVSCGDHALILTTQDGKTVVTYGIFPQGRSHPTFSDVTGIYLARASYGDGVTEITSDHRFRFLYRIYDSTSHTYMECSGDGKCTYSDGVLTYFPEHSNAPEQEEYLRDLVVKHEGGKLWVVNPSDDTIQCETNVKSLDLPPPLPGYRAAAQ